ncbi:MAG: hypothetical protein DRI90_18115 [Deltaproteobacteria bacterium]|nr:MAG: hypothetical protein DRI90_18115 [Deltaproteobacteria bacterium]
MKAVARVCFSATLLAVLASVSDAAAEPQANAGLTLGGAAVGPAGEAWDHGEFHLGLRGDTLFGRDDAFDFGIGPYAEIGTMAFDELQFGGGASLLLPVHASLPLVASVGAFGRVGDDDYGVEPGFSGALFWGSRSYNFHANYVMTVGLSVGYRQTFGQADESALLIAAQLDLAALGLPLVALINVLRGPTAEAAPLGEDD